MNRTCWFCSKNAEEVYDYYWFFIRPVSQAHKPIITICKECFGRECTFFEKCKRKASYECYFCRGDVSDFKKDTVVYTVRREDLNNPDFFGYICPGCSEKELGI